MNLQEMMQGLSPEITTKIDQLLAKGVKEADIASWLEEQTMAEGFDEVRGTQYADSRSEIIKRGSKSGGLGTRG